MPVAPACYGGLSRRSAAKTEVLREGGSSAAVSLLDTSTGGQPAHSRTHPSRSFLASLSRRMAFARRMRLSVALKPRPRASAISPIFS